MSALPRLHVVTDERIVARRDFVGQARALLAEGGEAVALHLRGGGAGGRLLLRCAEALVDAAAASGALLAVNDRVDVAALAGAPCVHLPQRSFPVAAARRLLPPGVLVGRSVHDQEGVRTARDEGADYVIAGPVRPTASHPGAAGRGVGWLGRMVAAAGGLPVVGIGGLRPSDVGSAMGAGAWGIAVLSGVWDAADRVAALAAYRDAVAASGETAACAPHAEGAP